MIEAAIAIGPDLGCIENTNRAQDREFALPQNEQTIVHCTLFVHHYKSCGENHKLIFLLNQDETRDQ